MAIKSVIDINLNDAAFKQYAAKFAAYDKQLKAHPGIWNKITGGVGAARSEFGKLVAEEVAALNKQKMMLEVQKEAARLTREQVTMWNTMTKTTAKTLTNVKEITTSLMQWGAVTGALSGLLGFGGLFGISRLAQGVASGRQESAGIASSYGSTKAFDINFSRYGAGSSFLSGISRAMMSSEGKAGLMGGLGLTDSELQGSTTDVGALVLERVRKMARSNPDQRFALDRLKAAGLEGYITPEMWNQLRLSGNAEFSGQQRMYREDTRNLGLSGKDQLAWQNLNSQLERAGKTIENVIVQGLTPLTPGITKLSTAITGLIKGILGNGDNDQIKRINDGFESFATYIGTPEFKEGMANFAQGIIYIGKKFGDIISYFGGGGLPATAKTMKQERDESGGGIIAGAKQLGSLWLNSGARVKPGVNLDPKLAGFAGRIQADVPGLGWVSSGNDGKHSATGGHYSNEAFDVGANSNPSKWAEETAALREVLKKLGKETGHTFSLSDETKRTGPDWTGPHYHIRVKVEAPVGSSATAQVNMLSGGHM